MNFDFVDSLCPLCRAPIGLPAGLAARDSPAKEMPAWPAGAPQNWMRRSRPGPAPAGARASR